MNHPDEIQLAEGAALSEAEIGFEPRRSKSTGDLAKRLSAAMASCHNLAENGVNRGYGDNFKYVTIGQVVNVGRSALADNGLCAFFDIVKHSVSTVGKTSKGNPILETCIVVDVEMMAAVSGEFRITRQVATARDFSDKGVNKALSQCMKNYYMKTLGISSGDEEETDGNTIVPDKPARKKRQPPKKQESSEVRYRKKIFAMLNKSSRDKATVELARKEYIKAHYQVDSFSKLTVDQLVEIGGEVAKHDKAGEIDDWVDAYALEAEPTAKPERNAVDGELVEAAHDLGGAA